MRGLNQVGNKTLDIIHSMCPTGHEAGDLGPNYAFLYYLIAATPEIATGTVSAMMLGYGVRLTNAFVESVPKLSLDDQKTLFVDSKGIARFEDDDAAMPGYSKSLNSDIENENWPGRQG